MEVLNLTSRQDKKVGIPIKIPTLIETQPEMHQKMMLFINTGCGSSFNVLPIRYMRDVVMYHEPTSVIIDDKTNVPGFIETMIHDLKIPVILESDSQRGIFRYELDGSVKPLTVVH